MTIKSLHYDYVVSFDQEVEALKARISKYRDAVAVIDERVYELYRGRLDDTLTGVPIYTVPALESTKTLEGVTELLDWLLAQKCNRSTTIIGIGGGIIQDLVTFTSNVFYRGASFVLVPTTLLSMCDSSIGAKCGINYGNFKNQLGVIHAPRGVHIVAEFLGTLDDIDVKSGYGEILKLAITGSEDATRNVYDTVGKSGLRGEHLLGLIRQSLEIKKVIIEKDEYESDLRRILNYGHTFGHALEALTNHAIPHGLAVAWGIDLINYLATNQDPQLTGFRDEASKFIKQHLDFKLTGFPAAEELVEMTRRDKKMTHGLLNLAIPRAYGELGIVATQLDERLVAVVNEYLTTRNVYA
jgi:3-dehydroquinate synthase